jgi:hypothetical protein
MDVVKMSTTREGTSFNLNSDFDKAELEKFC